MVEWRRVKLAVLKLDSDAPPATIADFYRKALKRYGQVLDCTGRSDRQTAGSELACDDDHPEAGAILLKAGRPDDQHDVAIKQEGNRTIISLVYVRGKKV